MSSLFCWAQILMWFCNGICWNGLSNELMPNVHIESRHTSDNSNQAQFLELNHITNAIPGNELVFVCDLYAENYFAFSIIIPWEAHITIKWLLFYFR